MCICKLFSFFFSSITQLLCNTQHSSPCQLVFSFGFLPLFDRGVRTDVSNKERERERIYVKHKPIFENKNACIAKKKK